MSCFRSAHKAGILAVSAALIACIVGVAAISIAESDDTTPTLKSSKTLPNGAKVYVYEKRVVRHYRFQGEPRVSACFLCYVELEEAQSKKRVRLWEQAYSKGYKGAVQFRPEEVFIGYGDSYTSPIAIAFREGFGIRFFEINPEKPLRTSFEDRVRLEEGKDFDGKDTKLYSDARPDRSAILLRNLIPKQQLLHLGSDPPRIRQLWRTSQGWHISIAGAKTEFHFLLSDGSKEWGSVDKP
jgi:hypothetical protein